MIIAITIMMFVNLIIMSSTDLFFRKLYNTNNLILLAIGILNLIFNPLDWGLALILFGVMLTFLILTFFLSKEGTIGGGDVKMMAVSMLFLNSQNMMFNYLVLLSVFSFITIIILKFKKERLAKYGMTMAPALMYAYSLTHLGNVANISIIITFTILQIITIIIYKLKGGEINEETVETT